MGSHPVWELGDAAERVRTLGNVESGRIIQMSGAIKR
jgi:hypothetical protein